METNTLAVKRILALVLSVALVLTTTPATALTAYAQDTGACAHVVHDEACGYAEGAKCTHECGEDCAEGCVHTEHDSDCGYIAAAPCKHEHDEDCGGLPATNNSPTHTTDMVVLGFATPTQAATVPLSTSRANLPLPETVEATLTDAATPTDIPVEWTDEDSYDGNTPGDYGFTGQLSAGYILADGISAPTFTVTVLDEAGPVVIIGFDPNPYHQPDDPDATNILVEIGTAAADIPLPSSLAATIEGGAVNDYSVAVSEWVCQQRYDNETWELVAGSYNPDEAGCYVFTPVLALKANESLADGVALPSVEVVVSQNMGFMTMAAGSDLTISDGTLGTHYTYERDSTTNTYALTITQGGNYTIGMASGVNTTTTDRIAVQSGLTNVNITLNGVSIDMSGTDYACAFDMTGATVNLTLTGSNTLKSGLGRAGLAVPQKSSGSGAFTSILTITATSTGSLTAVGGGAGAGIGDGAYNSNYNFGTVNIAGGTVNAQGGTLGAGIGTASNSPGDGIVNISGGKVTATGGGNGAGIGGGNSSAGCTVAISGGTVVANGSTSGPGIGAGAGAPSGTNGVLTITGGSVLRNSGTSGGSGREATAANGSVPVYRARLSGLPADTAITGLSGIGSYGLNDVYTDGNGYLYFWLPEGSYTVEVETSGSRHFGTFTQAANNDNRWPLTAFVPVTGISGIPGEMIAGTLELNGVVAPTNATNKTITWSLINAGTTNASLSDGNKLTTTAQGTVAVRATITGGLLSGNYTQDFSINIIADVLKVDGGTQNTDWKYENGNVVIMTGTAMTISGASATKYVKVNSGVTANLTIDDLYIDVSEQADNTAAFDITGATVNLTLTGTNTLKSAANSAGLQAPSGSTLVITSDSTGILTATGGQSGAGIGGETTYSTAGSITISGGVVNATGGNNGSGIGGGNGGDGGSITISGGVINAAGGSGGSGSISGGSGIGGGSAGAGGTINISGGSVTAAGGYNGAGIGGGYHGAGGTITISGGTVIATGHSYCAGIGGGLNASDNGTLTVTGGSIRRSGYSNREAATTNGSDNVYLTTLTVGESPVANTAVTAGSIDGAACTTGTPSGGAYGINDVATDGGGKLYFWLPAGTDVPVTITAGGSLYANTVSPATGNGAAATLVIPAITNHPENTTVTAGSIAGALSVAAYAPGVTLSYQWYSNTEASNTGGTQVSGATVSSFTIPTDLTKGDYYYFCEITINETGAKLRSNAATVTVQSSPAAAPTVPPEQVSKTAVSVTVKKPTGVSGDVEFSIDGTNWQGSGTFSGLNPNTPYSFYMRYAETATHSASAASPALTVTTEKAGLTGTVTIDNTTPKYLDTLTAVTTGLTSTPSVADLGTLSYQWTRDTANIPGETGSSYTLTADDVGKVINVTVTATNCDGSVSSTNSAAVEKATPAAPTNGVVNDMAKTFGFTVVPGYTAVTLYEYSIDSGSTWTDVTANPISVGNVAIASGALQVRVKATAWNDDGATLSSTAAFTASLEGSVSIGGTARFGETLTATANGIQGGATLVYQWKRDGSTSIGTNSTTYELVEADIGKTITVEITAAGYTGSITSSPTATVTKANGPAAPTGGVVDDDANTFSFTAVAGTTYEYTTDSWTTQTDYTPANTSGVITVGNVAIASGALKVRVKETNTHFAGATLTNATAFTATLEGSVSISGTAKFGATLTATASGTQSDATLTYTWKRGAVTVQTGTSNEYVLIAADIGQTLTVEVTAAGYTGTLTSAATGTVVKADGPAAPAPVTGSYTGNGTTFTYTVNTIPGAEYRIDGDGWTDDNVFTNNAPSSSHTFYARIKSTATHEAGAIGNTGAVAFVKLDDRTAPPLAYNVSGPADNRQISITPVTGAEYSFDSGAWGTVSSKDGYTTADTVMVSIRYAENATHNPSPANSASVNLAKQNQPAPPAFTMTYVYNSGANNFTVTIPTVTNGEYSFDGVNFSDINTTTANPGDFVTGYARYKETNDLNASPATASSLTLPMPVTSITVTGTGGADSITAGGGSLQMLANVQPAEATQTVTWSISSGSGANISGSGLLTATANGTVTVRATATDGTGVYGEKTITITGQTPPIVSVTSISGSSSGSTISTRGGTMQMSASVLPVNATNKTVTWSISSGSGASVNNSGLLTATANGYVTVRATANDGSGIYGEKYITISGQSSNNDGGGGSSSSGGGGSSYTPTTPVTTEKQPNMPTVAKVSVSGTVKDKVMTVNIITEKMAKDAIAAAGSNTNGIAVQFNVTGSGDYVSLTATFERKALEALKTAGVKYVQIGSVIIDLSLDTKAITGILAQTTGNITVTATRQTKLSDAAKAYIGSRPVFDITIKDGKGTIVSDLKGGSATIGIAYKPTSTEKTGNLYGVYVDGNGKPQLLTNSSYDNGKLIFKRGSLSVYGVGYKAPAPAFTDTANHWAKDNIDFVASRDLISGTSATAFSPDTAITRATFLMALGKLSGANMSGYTTSSFTDVPNTNPAMPYIEWAVKNKIVQGIGNNQFGPDNKITREDMVVMMVNYAKATGYTLPVSKQYAAFADDAKISSYAKDAVKAIQQTGVINGKTGNLFDPKGNATRAEASTILRRFVELVIDEGTARGWVQNDAGQWQYVNANGKAVTGWLNTEANKYWFDDKGVMAAGKWVQISGKWYYFYADGKLAVNTTIDGYTVGADGARK